jgi:hypothetical protein
VRSCPCGGSHPPVTEPPRGAVQNLEGALCGPPSRLVGSCSGGAPGEERGEHEPCVPTMSNPRSSARRATVADLAMKVTSQRFSCCGNGHGRQPGGGHAGLPRVSGRQPPGCPARAPRPLQRASGSPFAGGGRRGLHAGHDRGRRGSPVSAAGTSSCGGKSGCDRPWRLVLLGAAAPLPQGMRSSHPGCSYGRADPGGGPELLERAVPRGVPERWKYTRSVYCGAARGSAGRRGCRGDAVRGVW